MLEIKDLTVRVGKKKILKRINFKFEKGKIYAIMGPNGSGKSTFAYTVMGYPGYEVDKRSQIVFKGREIKNLDPDKRAKRGIFLSFQTPLALSGINLYQLIQVILGDKKDLLQLRQEVRGMAGKLKISEELLNRSLNSGASGGEKKKMEVLQAGLLNPQLAIFDEVDTGVDIDGLKTIANFLSKSRGDKTYILITHYNRILHYLTPDYVLVLIEGELKKIGDYRLAEEIEKRGYKKVVSGID